MLAWIRRLWRRWTGSRSSWAPFFTADQLLHFEHLLREHFHGRQVEIGDGWLRLGEADCGLDNLAQTCRALPEDEWPLQIAAHFANLSGSRRESEEWDRRKGDWEWARRRLLVRLYLRDSLPMGEFVRREDVPGLDTVLVVDLPSVAMSVRPEDFAAWGRPADEVFAAALANLAAIDDVAWQTMAIDPEKRVEVHALAGDGLYAASHVLRLERRRERMGPFGSLMAVPNRHLFILYPLATRAAIGAAVHLMELAVRLFRNGPGSITQDLYWVTPQGAFVRLPLLVEADGVKFVPPDEFLRVMEALPPE